MILKLKSEICVMKALEYYDARIESSSQKRMLLRQAREQRFQEQAIEADLTRTIEARKTGKARKGHEGGQHETHEGGQHEVNSTDLRIFLNGELVCHQDDALRDDDASEENNLKDTGEGFVQPPGQDHEKDGRPRGGSSIELYVGADARIKADKVTDTKQQLRKTLPAESGHDPAFADGWQHGSRDKGRPDIASEGVCPSSLSHGSCACVA